VAGGILAKKSFYDRVHAFFLQRTDTVRSLTPRR
jgi:hypothetical protein